MSNTLRSISTLEFIRRIKDFDQHDSKYALFLGAGCSVTSGIPAAATLVRDIWLPRLRDFRAKGEKDHEAWFKTIHPAYDPANPAACYGKIFDMLFFDPEPRQREIEKLCEGRTPGYGYAVLAQLIARHTDHFNMVLTTNFDDLVSDALFLYTDARPLVVHHESLAEFIRPTRKRPLVVKLHGDLRLTPHNSDAETAALDKQIERNTATILRDRGIIFMGYGGSDASILNMLRDLPGDALRYGVYWVHPNEPSGDIRSWLIKRNGTWVQSGWFDEVMLHLQVEFNLPDPSGDRFANIFSDFFDKRKALQAAVDQKPADAPDKQALQQALTSTEASLPEMWKLLAEADRLEKSDPDAAARLLQDATTSFPNHPAALGNHAIFLHTIRKDHDAAEDLYKRVIAIDPNHANNLGNYASLLTIIRKDHDAAEDLYKRALEAEPNDASQLGNYANFLMVIRKDHDAAEALYKRALEADPYLATNLSNYAVFLNNIRKDSDTAEALYERAIAAVPNYVPALVNYAVFLTDIRKNHSAAEDLYRRAIAADPNHANNLSNYAGLLLGLGKPTGFEMLQRALTVLKKSPLPGTELECAFYLFANGPANQRTSGLSMAKQLITSGTRSPGWDFSLNIQRATEAKHPEAKWLPKLAAVISDGADPATLSKWPAWQKA